MNKMPIQFENQREQFAEDHAFHKGVAHTLRDKSAWHYSLIDFRAGFDKCYELTQEREAKLLETINIQKEALKHLEALTQIKVIKETLT